MACLQIYRELLPLATFSRVSNSEEVSYLYSQNTYLNLKTTCHIKGALSGLRQFFGSGKHFKNDEKYFLFHLKRSFRSQDIQIFVLTFWSCIKNVLIKKIRLISNFMKSQPG